MEVHANDEVSSAGLELEYFLGALVSSCTPIFVFVHSTGPIFDRAVIVFLRVHLLEVDFVLLDIALFA